MITNKDRYRKFCKKEEHLPLFFYPEWLDAVVCEGGNWDVCLSMTNDEVQAALPYYLDRKYGFNMIVMPPLTPYLGPYIKYPEEQKYAKKLSYEKQVCEELISQLPKVDFFEMDFPPYIANWLPFYWSNFDQITRYTYIINDLSDTDKIFSDFRSNIRREIRKAEKSLKVVESEDISQLYHLCERMYSSNDKAFNFSSNYLKKLYNVCKENNSCKLLFAMDSKDNIHSGILLAWDKNSSYYLVGATNPNYKNSGAMSFLMWECIKRSSQFVNTFNFEGSMVESVERFFRSFGAVQTPYFNIKKTNSVLLKYWELMR
ncbi:MAG: GNAT family N-acetyltransferase [Flavobacteriales bacterium]